MKLPATLLFLLYAGALYAQPDRASDPVRIGLFGAYNRTFHNADFRALPGIPNCCEQFGNGNGNGIALGVLYEWPFSSFWLIAIRAGYATHGATLTSREKIIVNGVGQGVQGIIEHNMTAGLSSIGVEPLMGCRLTNRLSLYGGVRLGLMLQTTFQQKETLIEPSDGTFENGRSTRNELSGTIPEAERFTAALTAGIGYDLPMSTNGALLLTPEIFYHASLTPIVKSYIWYAHGLQAGVSVKLLLGEVRSRQPDTLLSQPVVSQPAVLHEPPGPPVLSAGIERVTGFTADGTEQDNPNLTVTEYRSTTAYTLLPYIFFEENSSKIPERYRQIEPSQREAQTIELHGDSILQIYRNILNSIGKQLTLHPEATITLTGCNANTDLEKGNLSLSKDRALAVRDYLENIWLISRKRIEIQAQNLPNNPSSLSGDVSNASAAMENRRVEIRVSIPEILAPSVTVDTLREVQPNRIRFYPSIRADAGLNEWKLSLYQGESIAERTGAGETPKFIDWKITDSEIPQGPDTLVYILELWDNDRYARTRPKYVPLRHLSLETKRQEGLPSMEIQRYHLMLFDFDKTTISREQLVQVEAVNALIPKDASISITGYTDAMGDNNYNKRLSLERAQAVARFLHADNAVVQGNGESSLYDNSLPEGRFYNRNVIITIISTK